MATSDLTLALLGSQAQNSGVDPALAAMMPRLQLGQNMVQQGLNASPTDKWGALSRLAQSIVGNVIVNKADRGIQDYYRNAQNDFNNQLSAIQSGWQGQGQQSVAPAQEQSAAPAQSVTADQLTPVVKNLESGGSNAPGIVGDGGAARGPMQVHQAALTDVNRANGTNYTLDDITKNPNLGTQVGNAYLQQQIDRFPGHPELALAAYNGGPTAMAKSVANGSGLSGMPPGAQSYAQRGMAMLQPGAGGAYGNQNVGAGMQDPTLHSQQLYNLALMAARSPIPSIKAQAPILTAMASQALEHPHVMQIAPGVWQGQGGIGAPTFAPTPRTYTDVHGNVGYVGSGGQTGIIAPNPTGITGNSPESNNARVLAEIGEKINKGTATPEERAAFNGAYTSFQHYATGTDPATGALISHPTVPVPPGTPNMQPGSSTIAPASSGNAVLPLQGGANAPGGVSPNGIPNAAGVVTLTGGSRGPNAIQNITEGSAKDDLARIAEEQSKIASGHTILGTTQTIRNMLPDVTNGVGADQRLALSRILTTVGVDPKEVESIVGTNAPAGELLQKKLFELSTGAVRAMGAREPGSVIAMFRSNFPGMNSQNMTIEAMTRLLDMDQIFKEDEINARRAYINQGVQGLAGGGQYRGLEGYNPPNPKIYQAAAIATGGMPFSAWSHGLTPQQQAQALQLGSRLYPDASALDANGVRRSFAPRQQPQGNPGGG